VTFFIQQFKDTALGELSARFIEPLIPQSMLNEAHNVAPL